MVSVLSISLYLKPYLREMKYDPNKHHRRSIRLKGYDYSKANAYFVTICSYNRECLFGYIEELVLISNQFGKVLNTIWNDIPAHFKNVILDEFIIMPNHLHGIIIITDKNTDVGAKHSLNTKTPVIHQSNTNASPMQNHPKGTKSGSLPSIIQNFCSITTRKINRIRKTPGSKLWQRNYSDRIIRNKKELNKIRQYIINNPLKWHLDNENPENWDGNKSKVEKEDSGLKKGEAFVEDR